MKSCWVVTEGKVGMELQGVALAEALNIPELKVKRVLLRFPWRFFSPSFRLLKRFCLSNKGDKLEAPYPNLMITVGRRSVLAGLLVKSKSPATKLVCINNPRIDAKHFDVVISSEHDGLKEENNIVPVFGSLHRITCEKLYLARQEFNQFFEKFKTPRLGVIIGGNNKYYTMDLKTAQGLIEKLKNLQKEKNISLFITASRRTPKEVLELFSRINWPNTFYWDHRRKDTPNPYLGILACSDALLVSCESANMISEACATDLPVYIFSLPGQNSRFDKFHKDLLGMGRSEWFEGDIKFSKNKPINATSEVVGKVKRLLEKQDSIQNSKRSNSL